MPHNNLNHRLEAVQSNKHDAIPESGAFEICLVARETTAPSKWHAVTTRSAEMSACLSLDGVARQGYRPLHPPASASRTTEGIHRMAKLFAVYQQPKDPAAFDSYYFSKHVPLAKTIPGLKGYEVTSGDVTGMAGKHGVYLVAVLEFDSMEAIGAAMASPQGQATAADLANFASAGVDVMMAETKLI